MYRVQSPHLGLETLDQRLVPSATTLDLTTVGAEATASGAIVQQTDAQPTGTGYIRSFVRVQGAAPGGGIEQGFNTDGRPLSFDENSSPQFTRSLTLGQVPVVTINGTAYREFLLDINQKSSASKLSLDEVRIYLGSTGNVTNLAALNGAVFDLDSEKDVSVLLNARLNNGSGSGDMTLLVPESAFAGGTANSFVYLYSKFGGVTGATANSGFEEWAVKAAPPTQPPPVATGSLSGHVFYDVGCDGVNGDEIGLAGVRIELRYTNADGVTVSLGTVTTDANGFYQFTGLAAGTYTLIQIDQPTVYTRPDGSTVSLVDGDDYAGSLGGDPLKDSFGRDMLATIQLFDGSNGVDYNFTEWRETE